MSELLSLAVGDVLGPDGRFVGEVYVRRRSTKGKRTGRRLPLHPEAKVALGRHLVTLRAEGLILKSTLPLFGSAKGKGMKAIDRRSAHRIVARAAAAAGLGGGLSTHSWRKWLAVQVYAKTEKCLIKTGASLGHRQIETTWRYCRSLGVQAERVLLDL